MFVAARDQSLFSPFPAFFPNLFFHRERGCKRLSINRRQHVPFSIYRSSFFFLNLGHCLSEEVYARTIVLTGISDEEGRILVLYFRIFRIFVLTEDSSISEKQFCNFYPVFDHDEANFSGYCFLETVKRILSKPFVVNVNVNVKCYQKFKVCSSYGWSHLCIKKHCHLFILISKIRNDT